MLVDGIQCNGCGDRVWSDDPRAEEWTNSLETRPSDGKRTTRHFCPSCQDDRDDQLRHPEDHLELTSGQHRVLDPSWVNPQLAQVFAVDPGDHHADDQKAGVPVTTWDQPTGKPLPIPVAPSSGNGRRKTGKAGASITQAATSVLLLVGATLGFGRFLP